MSPAQLAFQFSLAAVAIRETGDVAGAALFHNASRAIASGHGVAQVARDARHAARVWFKVARAIDRPIGKLNRSRCVEYALNMLALAAILRAHDDWSA